MILYAQNSEIIKTIRIPKNFFLKSHWKIISIPHMWYTISFVVYYTTIVVSVNDERGSIFENNFPMGILRKFFRILIVLMISEFWA